MNSFGSTQFSARNQKNKNKKEREMKKEKKKVAKTRKHLNQVLRWLNCVCPKIPCLG